MLVKFFTELLNSPWHFLIYIASGHIVLPIGLILWSYKYAETKEQAHNAALTAFICLIGGFFVLFLAGCVAVTAAFFGLIYLVQKLLTPKRLRDNK